MNSFDLIKKLYFVRTGGSTEEYQACSIIEEEIKKLGVEVAIESFDVDGYDLEKAKLYIDGNEIDCTGVGFSSSTQEEGIKGEFIYLTSLADVEMKNVENKICLIHNKLVNNKMYEKLVEKKALGLILCCGDVYKEKTDVDLDPYMYREVHYKHGKIPAVCIRMKDAEKILENNPREVSFVLLQNEHSNESHNVVATISGTTYPDEIVAFTAHYDSVSYSKGAYDNATGSAGIFEILKYYQANKPQRTLKFIWCGSEEMGLLGSKAYVKAHEEEIKKYKLCINIDMIGVTIGYDIACITGQMSLVHYLKYISKEVGFPILIKQGVYSSDSTPFADASVPAISFARISPQGGATIHSRLDIIDHLTEENYHQTCNFIIDFSNRLINSICFPVEEGMPENMKEELDYYLKRKERKE